MPDADEARPARQSSSDIAELVRLARAGDPRAREALFQQLRPYLLFIANDQLDERLQMKLGPSDIVQQSMMRAAKDLDHFRGSSEAEFKGWLRQILINETRLAQRTFATNKRDVRREQEADAGEVSNATPELADSALTPATQILADEQAAMVRRLIDQLPEEYRTVVQLRNWEELTFEAIAERLNMSTSGVAKIWYRALVEIQKLYQRENESRIQ